MFLYSLGPTESHQCYRTHLEHPAWVCNSLPHNYLPVQGHYHIDPSLIYRRRPGLVYRQPKRLGCLGPGHIGPQINSLLAPGPRQIVLSRVYPKTLMLEHLAVLKHFLHSSLRSRPWRGRKRIGYEIWLV
jgi:hypothetical protein